VLETTDAVGSSVMEHSIVPRSALAVEDLEAGMSGFRLVEVKVFSATKRKDEIASMRCHSLVAGPSGLRPPDRPVDRCHRIWNTTAYPSPSWAGSGSSGRLS